MTEDRAVALARTWGQDEIDGHGGRFAGLYQVDVHASKDEDGHLDRSPIGGVAVHVKTVPPSRINAIVLVQNSTGHDEIITSPWFNRCHACNASALYHLGAADD